MGAQVFVDDMNLLARLHMRRAMPQSPWQREVTFSVKDVTGSLSRIEQARAYGLVFRESPEIEDLMLTAEALRYRRPGMTFISGDALTEWLHPLQERLSKFLLVGFFLSRSGRDWRELYERSQQALPVPGLCVFATSELDAWSSRNQWHLVDPTPPVLVAGRELDAWPGIVLWSPTGHCAHIPMSALLEVLNELREVGDAARDQPVERLRLYDEVLLARGSPRRSPKLLQLSDLHFGTREAADHNVYLGNSLHQVVEEVGRVVITGDLMDTPTQDNLLAFDAFASRIAINSKANPIVIPGNHDERKLYGTIWQTLGQVVRLDSKMVEVDHRLRCLFLGFDSTLDATLAEGLVSAEQTRRVAAQIELEISRPGAEDVKGYCRIALVHHHPLPFKTEQESFREYCEKYVKERVLGMREGERFLRWCAKREALLVLHGHKHLPRRRDQSVSIGPSTLRKVMVVGCGTSLGVRGQLLGYNLITWDVTGKAWSVEFFVSEPDGGGFFPYASGFSSTP